MADKVMDWKGQPLADLAADGTLDVANVDGRQVGIPITAEAFGLLYNKSVLDTAGVDPASYATRSDLAAAFESVAGSGPLGCSLLGSVVVAWRPLHEHLPRQLGRHG